jgi:hypothetical protein
MSSAEGEGIISAKGFSLKAGKSKVQKCSNIEPFIDKIVQN